MEFLLKCNHEGCRQAIDYYHMITENGITTYIYYCKDHKHKDATSIYWTGIDNEGKSIAKEEGSENI